MPEKEGKVLDDKPSLDEDGTISLRAFMDLGKKVMPHNRKVDWEGVLDDILDMGRPFSTRTIRTLASKHSIKGGPVSLYYSEITRVIAKWDRGDGLTLTKRYRDDGRVFYYLLQTGDR